MVRTLGLEADRLMTVEVRPRFVCPLRRAIKGEISGRPFDIEMLGWLMLVSMDAEIGMFWIASLTDDIECESIGRKIEETSACSML